MWVRRATGREWRATARTAGRPDPHPRGSATERAQEGHGRVGSSRVGPSARPAARNLARAEGKTLLAAHARDVRGPSCLQRDHRLRGRPYGNPGILATAEDSFKYLTEHY